MSKKSAQSGKSAQSTVQSLFWSKIHRISRLPRLSIIPAIP